VNYLATEISMSGMTIPVLSNVLLYSLVTAELHDKATPQI